MAAPTPDLDALAQRLTAYTITPANRIQQRQMVHRLQLLGAWFGGFPAAVAALRGARIVELGCGQGDMTVALAHVAQSGGDDDQDPESAAALDAASSSVSSPRVRAVDPAPLSYGSPHTLGECQTHISAGPLGHAIQWVQRDPLDLLQQQQQQPGLEAEFVVLAHSLFYLPSEAYVARLLQALRGAVADGDGSAPKTTTKLLLAEWGQRASSEAARAHVLAVEAQALQPEAEANVRTVLAPARLRELAREAGWGLEREEWIVRPEVDDGRWEVTAARQAAKKPGCVAEVAAKVQEMEACIRRNEGSVECMDVWTGVFVAV